MKLPLSYSASKFVIRLTLDRRTHRKAGKVAPPSKTPVAALRMTGTTITGSPHHGRDTVGQWKADETLDPDVTRVFLGHHPDIEPVLSEVWWAAEHLEQLGLAPPHTVTDRAASS